MAVNAAKNYTKPTMRKNLFNKIKVSIKFATVADAKATIAKVKRIKKPYARKIQILTVMEQRAKVMGKTEVVRLCKEAKLQLKKQHQKEK
jgi:hypothetical protein